MLEYCVHLEFLRVTSIEEAEHVVYCDASVKNRTTNEEIQGLFQTELSFVVKHGCDLARLFGVHHIDSPEYASPLLPPQQMWGISH